MRTATRTRVWLAALAIAILLCIGPGARLLHQYRAVRWMPMEGNAYLYFTDGSMPLPSPPASTLAARKLMWARVQGVALIGASDADVRQLVHWFPDIERVTLLGINLSEESMNKLREMPRLQILALYTCRLHGDRLIDFPGSEPNFEVVYGSRNCWDAQLFPEAADDLPVYEPETENDRPSDPDSPFE